MTTCIDPITLTPAQLIFKHWELIDQHCSVHQSMVEVSYQGADIHQLNTLNDQLDTIDEQINLASSFLKLAGFTDTELN